jgi:hypothetical protein
VTHSAADIVRQYIAIRDFMKDESKAFADRMEPYKNAMEALQGAAAELMRETGQRALSTEHGTAFPVNKTRVTCENQDKFLEFVREAQAWNFLTKHVAKEAVDDWMEKNEGRVPPGIKVEGYVDIQFRKA